MLSEAMRTFFQRNHIMCLGTASGSQSYSTPLFYLFGEDDVQFCFMSSKETRHGREAVENPQVSAAVYAHHRDVAKLQGAQITGEVRMYKIGDPLMTDLLSAYADRYPESEAMFGDESMRFWTLRAEWIKFTDNTVKFGYKEIWSRP